MSSHINKTTDLKTFRAFSFDIFGTLIDDESGVYEALHTSPLLQSLPADHHMRTSRTALLDEFFRFSNEVQFSNPRDRHLPLVYKQLSSTLTPGRVEADALEAEANAFAASPARWPAFPDTVAAMQAFAQRGYKLAPLTNIDNATFATVRAGPLKGVHFDAVYTAEDIGSYKPARRNFDYLFAHLESDFGVKKEEVLHVAHSLSHDHVPANELKFHNCYVVRNNVANHGTEKDPEYEWKVADLAELAALVEQAWSG
ncbi:MAG: hypothetical protein M1822_003122 [Bathelium mastoideum]|nr:MAG: hypothetical protein M1822_003122 [Bathelium mastoideum]